MAARQQPDALGIPLFDCRKRRIAVARMLPATTSAENAPAKERLLHPDSRTLPTVYARFRTPLIAKKPKRILDLLR